MRNLSSLNKVELNILNSLNELCKPSLKNFNVLGEISLKDEKRVGVVGSRKMTAYGRQILREICTILVDEKVTVVSGLMYGVDIEAQKQVLALKGRTIGVLGYGFNYINKNRYVKEVVDKIIIDSAGAVISEFEENQSPQIWTFPKRNRIVAGLSDYLIIVEAGERSGTLITADLALEMGKDVYVVPGSIYNKQSYGCNKLLAEGAIPLFDLKILSSAKMIEKSVNRANLEALMPESKQIYNYILDNKDRMPVDKFLVMQNTVPSVNQFMIALSELELYGLVVVQGDIIWLN